MSSNEDYLDSLLKAALEPSGQAEADKENVTAENDKKNKEENTDSISLEELEDFDMPKELEAFAGNIEEKNEKETAEENGVENVVEEIDEIDEIDELGEIDERAELAEESEGDAAESKLETVIDQEASMENSLDELLAQPEELEIDLNNPDDLDLLLGIKEKEPQPVDMEEEAAAIEAELESLLSEESVVGEAAEDEEVEDEEAAAIEAELESLLSEESLVGETAEDAGAASTDAASRDAASTDAVREEIENVLDLSEDKDITELLDELGPEDEDLAEINSLLKKSDSNELVSDDDMLSLLEGIGKEDGAEIQTDHAEEQYDFFSEVEPEEGEAEAVELDAPIEKKPKKKRKFLFGRKKKEKQEAAEEVQQGEESKQESQEESEQAEALDIGAFLKEGEDIVALEDDAVGSAFYEMGTAAEDGSVADLDLIPERDSEKKKGFFGKLFATLTEESEEDEIREINEIEDIKEKKPKKKKGKKAKTEETAADDNGAILEEMDAEGDVKKGKKKKKPKKEKKPKQVKEKETNTEKKLPRKLVVLIFVLCFSMMGLIILAANFLPRALMLQNGRKAFYQKDYLTTYQEMTGKKLNASDSIILDKATIILKVQRKYSAYESFYALDLEVEALNALLEGQVVYLKLYDQALNYGIAGEIESIYAKILTALSEQYGLTEEAAKEINELETDLEYTRAVRSLAEEQNPQIEPLETQPQETEPPDVTAEYEDVLPEEMVF